MLIAPEDPFFGSIAREVRKKFLRSGIMTRAKSGQKNQSKTERFTAQRANVLKTSIILSIILCIGCATLSGDPVGPAPNPISVKEIVEMTGAGIPSEIIIEKIQQSQTVYRLQASQLVQLKKMGVSDQVINYMQQTYIDAARRNQAYEDWSNFSLADDGFWYGGPFYGGPFWY